MHLLHPCNKFKYGIVNNLKSQVVEETISTVTTTGTGGSSGGLDEAALIAQIISVLQPQINQAVTSVIRQQ